MRLQAVFLFGLAAFLNGCGGGGGNDHSSNPPPIGSVPTRVPTVAPTPTSNGGGGHGPGDNANEIHSIQSGTFTFTDRTAHYKIEVSISPEGTGLSYLESRGGHYSLQTIFTSSEPESGQ